MSVLFHSYISSSKVSGQSSIHWIQLFVSINHRNSVSGQRDSEQYYWRVGIFRSLSDILNYDILTNSQKGFMRKCPLYAPKWNLLPGILFSSELVSDRRCYLLIDAFIPLAQTMSLAKSLVLTSTIAIVYISSYQPRSAHAHRFFL